MNEIKITIWFCTLWCFRQQHPGFRKGLVPYFGGGPKLGETPHFILDRNGNPAKPMEKLCFRSDCQKLFLRVMRLFQIPASVSLWG